MILLLGHQHDSIIHALHELLKETNSDVLRLFPEDLIFASEWLHQINRNGQTSTEITLPNQRKIFSSAITALFNRIQHLQINHFVNAVDRVYANAEFNALYLSFLKSLEAVAINPVQTSLLATDTEHNWYYKVTASRLGIPVADEQFTSSPKWENNAAYNVFEPEIALGQSNHRLAPYLTLTDQPAVLKEKVEQSATAWWVDGVLFSDYHLPFVPQLNKLAAALKQDFMEINVVLSGGKIKLQTINPRPSSAPDDVLKQLALTISKKSKA